MKVYFGLEEFKKRNKIVATIGTFDGVHLGHKKLLKNLIEQSKKCDGENLLLTFYPHPRMVLFPDKNEMKLLNSQEEKINLLDKLGIDHLIIHPFTREFSRLNSTEFVREVLVNTVGVHRLVIGYDHHFGRNREGSIQSLSELSNLYQFELDEIEAEVLDDISVSSTKIRNALNEGNIEMANEYLNYKYQINGKVVAGKKLGRTIGFPTANIEVKDQHKLIPCEGVYAVLVQVEGKKYKGMLNIGKRPTVEDTSNTTIEVHIFDFDKTIYEQQISIEFVNRIRNEKKFKDTEELVEQLEIDQNRCLSILR
ncbi:MAG: riboflavin biosynthesis protein RibF [Crocinitomicaceae bacterium]|nr:riboflavin biosynthesis protein RibF [Crocinitomicaceae bacterium]